MNTHTHTHTHGSRNAREKLENTMSKLTQTTSHQILDSSAELVQRCRSDADARFGAQGVALSSHALHALVELQQ